MPVYMCQEDFNLYVSRLPKRVRWAQMQLIKRMHSIEVVDKDTCQVCMGKFLRDAEPVYQCQEHLRALYMRQPMARLQDPSFTLRFICVGPGTAVGDAEECYTCKTGRAPDV